MSKEFLASTLNKMAVFYDSLDSHTATHFEDTPHLKELVNKVLEASNLTKQKEFFEKDMGRIIGTSDLVENRPGDTIVYAIRKNRDIYTSFNKTQSSVSSSLVTVCLQQIDEKSYELVSAWIGTMYSPPFPGDPNETPDSKEYWSKHSLVWGNQEIVDGTLTDRCPW